MSNILDENGHAIADVDVNIFNFHPETREYIGVTIDHLIAGFGIPADSTTDALPSDIPAGSIAIRSDDNKSWNIVEDHRGQLSYFKSNRVPYVVDYIGEIHSDFTQIKPESEFSVWDESTNSWLIDETSMNAATVDFNRQKQVNLTNQATQLINVLNYAVNGGYATEVDNENMATLQKFAYDVNKLDVNNVNIEWPEFPVLAQEPVVQAQPLETFEPVEFLVEETPIDESLIGPTDPVEPEDDKTSEDSTNA